MLLKALSGFLGYIQHRIGQSWFTNPVLEQLYLDYLGLLCPCSESILTEYFFCSGTESESRQDTELARLLLKYPVWARSYIHLPDWHIPVLDYGSYGYAKYLAYKPPAPEEYKTYFYHAGLLLGMVYWLEGSDMHCENIIAHGTYPYIVDLETILGVKEAYSVLDSGMLHVIHHIAGEKAAWTGAILK